MITLYIIIIIIIIKAVVSQGAEVTKGENARMSSFVGAIAVADLVKTTLGPKGMVISYHIYNINQLL